MDDMASRTRPGRPFPGPREVRYLLELTSTYARGLRDVIEVIGDAVDEHPETMAGYRPLLGHLRALVADCDGLAAVQHECRRLLGEV